MSGVPVGRRKPSRFDAQHNFYQLRDEVTRLMINNFGFSKEKHFKSIEKYRENHRNAPNVDEIVDRYVQNLEAFDKWFIDKERDAILEILRKIESEFTFGNSIYPSDTPAKMEEYLERRKHIDAAIAECYVLKQELQYIIRTLPVDMNKFGRFSDAIDHQISIYKGVRTADNRFLKDSNKKNDNGDKKSKKNDNKPETGDTKPVDGDNDEGQADVK